MEEIPRTRVSPWTLGKYRPWCARRPPAAIFAGRRFSRRGPAGPGTAPSADGTHPEPTLTYPIARERETETKREIERDVSFSNGHICFYYAQHASSPWKVGKLPDVLWDRIEKLFTLLKKIIIMLHPITSPPSSSSPPPSLSSCNRNTINNRKTFLSECLFHFGR